MNDRRLHRPSAPRSLRLGDLRVSYVPDGAMLLKTAASPRWAAHGGHLNDTGHLVANTGGLLVEYRDRALLIDAGFGPRSVPEDAARPDVGAVHGGSLPANLARLGRDPQQVETVAFTRLRLEHLGWAYADPPVFTRAGFVVPKSEWENRDSVPGLPPAVTSALEPRLRLVVPGEEVFPGVHALALDDQTGFTISSQGSRLLAFGTTLHSPLQVRYPDWSVLPDPDPEHSTGHRRRLLAELRRPDTLGFGISFADVVFGRVRPGRRGSVWQPC